MHILIAPNAFKNSLRAEEAAEAILGGLKQSTLRFSHELFPVGDGGNGTAALIVGRQGGRRVNGQVRDPLGRTIGSGFGLVDAGQTAVIEMADASGLQFLKPEELNPLLTSSAGTGDLMKLALDAGARKIILAMGGSATVDGGTGILRALGVRFLDAGGADIPDRPDGLLNLQALDLSGIDNRIRDCACTVLCDVHNTLLGPAGAAAVFGPQKGATEAGVRTLDAALARFREVVLGQFGLDMASFEYGGTAGGAAAGVQALLGARLVNGIDYFLDTNGFGEALDRSQLVITGEGSIDNQTLQGKGPFGVASRAKSKGIPVIALAGKLPSEDQRALREYFDVLLAIGQGPSGLAEAMQATARNLARVSRSLGQLLALSAHQKVS